MPPQHRTLRNAIHHSYRLLNEAERTLFRSLGVFVGGFDLAALEAVVDERLETGEWRLNKEPNSQPLLSTLRSLVGKSLVHTETLPTGEQRFLLLETIHEFALEQLRAHGEEGVLRQRHYAVYLQRFRTGDSHLRGPEALAWFARLEPEQDNLRAALQWMLDEARYEDMAWLMTAADWFWFQRGQWYERGRWLAHLLPRRRDLRVDLHLKTLIDVYSIGRAVEEFQPLNRWQDEMLQLLEICPNQHLHSSAWHFIACYSSDFSNATAAWERSIAAARLARAGPALGPEFCLLADCDFILGNPLWAYATALIERGEFAQALPLLTESREIFKRRGSRYEMADSLGTLGLLAFMQGDLAEAHTYLDEAVTIAAAFNYQEMVGLWQPLLGLVTLYEGKIPEAYRLLNASLRLCLELNDKHFLARIYAYLAETALWEGELDRAEQALAQSLAYDTEARRIIIYELERLWVAARLATAQQQYQRAATLFGLAEKAHSHIQHAVAGPMRDLADAALTTVRSELDTELFAQTFAAGQQLSLTEAFATLLAPSFIMCTMD